MSFNGFRQLLDARQPGKGIDGFRRLRNYWRQNNSRRLTPAQRRRDRKKVNKFMKNWR
ncbi:hypothetical protein [Streptomyces sp. NPDC046832]|uniref:hypothetical protein n=1 Tax=Streptomyces sp. NPDC046832 TaxID=3155020 RepID=UPI0033E1B041